MSRSNAGGSLDTDKTRHRSHGPMLDVPLDPVVQENEVVHDSPEAATRKLPLKVMAEKVAGSGVFFRAFVKSSKTDRVLLYFPEDTDPCILEWVYKSSSRIHRGNCPKGAWKYQGNGAWKLKEEKLAKKKPKGCKRKPPQNHTDSSNHCTQDVMHILPQCDGQEEPEKKKLSQKAEGNAEPARPMGMSIDSPWVETPVSRWFRIHQQFTDEYSTASPMGAAADSQGPSGNQADNGTPQASADDACLDDSDHDRRAGEQACQLRFQRDGLEDDGSYSDGMPHNSPAASGCDQPNDQANQRSRKQWESQAWSQGSPSNASGSDEQICFKTANYLQLPSAASLSDYSCEAFQNCRHLRALGSRTGILLRQEISSTLALASHLTLQLK